MDDKKRAEIERLRQYSCPESDHRSEGVAGVLLSDQIEHYARSFKLVDPFTESSLKAAGYELTIGDEYVLGGKKQALRKDGEIRIPPFNVVVIKTAETINLPRFLIARWNLRVKWAYEGLLWVGAAQVDPGWVGHLFCPIYNLSNKEVIVRAGDPIALMDFVTTTEYRPNVSVAYARPPKRVLLDEYNAVELESALYTLAETKLAAFDKRIEGTKVDVENRMGALQGRIDNFVSITFAVVGLLFAAVSLFFGKSEQSNWWDPSVFWICALAIIVSMFAWVNSRSSVQWFRKTWQRILFELFIFSTVLAAIVFFSLRTQSKIRHLTDEIQQLQQEIGPNPKAVAPPK
jgi:deoxycytidine triphosphate deaminase